MKAKSMILIMIALGCGLVASIGVSQVMVQGSGNDAPVEKKSDVLVAVGLISVAQQLTEDNVKVEQWPEELIPEDAVTSLKEIEEKYSKQAVVKGQVIHSSMLANEDEVRKLTIQDGFRAMSIKVSMEESLSGMLQAGDRVDITGFFKLDEESFAKTFLQDIQVFAINDKTERIIDPEGKSLVAKTVTLSVTPHQVQKILVGKRSGQLHLSLRSHSDTGNEDNTGRVSLDDLINDERDDDKRSGRGDEDRVRDPKSLDGWLDVIAQAKNNPPVAAVAPVSMDVMTPSGVKRYTWSDSKQPPQVSDMGGGFAPNPSIAPQVPAVPVTSAATPQGAKPTDDRDENEDEPDDVVGEA